MNGAPSRPTPDQLRVASKHYVAHYVASAEDAPRSSAVTLFTRAHHNREVFRHPSSMPAATGLKTPPMVELGLRVYLS